MSNGRCPNCNESLGIVRSDDPMAQVGAMIQHRRCGAVLVVERCVHGEFKVRLATKEEKGKKTA